MSNTTNENIEERAENFAKSHTGKQAPFRKNEHREHFADGVKDGYVQGYTEALQLSAHCQEKDKWVSVSDVKKILGLPTKLQINEFELMDDSSKEYYVEEFQWLVLPHVGWVRTEKETADKWNLNPEFSQRETRLIYKLKYL
jgi:hypothetical protein